MVTWRTIFEKNISNENDGHLVSSLLPINEYSMQSSGKSKRVTFRGAWRSLHSWAVTWLWSPFNPYQDGYMRTFIDEGSRGCILRCNLHAPLPFSVLCMSFNSETCHSYMKVRDTSKTTQFTWHNLLFNWHQHLYWKSIIISMLKYFNKKSYSTEQVCFYQMNKILLTFVIETITQSQGKKM